MNFFFQRNPRRLIEAAGMYGVYGLKDERLFLSRAADMKADDLRPLVLVVGGFMDQVLANSYAISEQYPPDLAAKHDVWFREHYEVRFMRRLVRFYAQRGKPVALVGHSWGGNAVANEIARKVPVSIEFMATLDPVSRKGPPPRRLENVRRWINVYVDYATATWLDLPNCVARVGGPWGRTPAADENVACSSDVKHADALVMFRKYAEKALRERMG